MTTTSNSIIFSSMLFKSIYLTLSCLNSINKIQNKSIIEKNIYY